MELELFPRNNNYKISLQEQSLTSTVEDYETRCSALLGLPAASW